MAPPEVNQLYKPTIYARLDDKSELVAVAQVFSELVRRLNIAGSSCGLQNIM
jgi:hypothetical protein